MTLGVHPTAAAGFGDAAAAYDRGRPRYPMPAVEAIAALVAQAPPGPLVDLAAGTGIFTSALVDAGLAPVAVEPVAAMRIRAASRLPQIPIVAATAEALPFRDRSLGAITVAQAFHWFDAGRAVRELERVAATDAPVIAVYNVRVADDPVHRALDRVWEPYRRDTPTHRSGAWRGAFDDAGGFAPLRSATFPNAQVVDAEGIVDRVVSVSFIAALPDDERARVADLARDVLAAAERTTLPYRTEVWWTTRRG